MKAFTCPSCGHFGEPSKAFEGQGLAKCGGCDKLVDPTRKPSAAQEQPAPASDETLGPRNAYEAFAMALGPHGEKILFALPILFILIGTQLAIWATALSSEEHRIFNEGVPSVGVIKTAKVEQRRSRGEYGSHDYEVTLVTVEVTEFDDTPFEFSDSVPMNQEYLLGTEVDVLVDAENPARSRLASEVQNWGFGYELAAVFLAIYAVGVAMFSDLFWRTK